jgi:hypothetical protein
MATERRKPAKKTAAKNAAPKSVKSAEASETGRQSPRYYPAQDSPRPQTACGNFSAQELGESEVLISDDEIRIRAYFIAEQRMREGRPGSSDNDWLEARRQLQDEAVQRA